MFVSNTAHHQTWQNNGEDTSGDPTRAPGWVMKVEGRLLDVSLSRHSLSGKGGEGITTTCMAFMCREGLFKVSHRHSTIRLLMGVPGDYPLMRLRS